MRKKERYLEILVEQSQRPKGVQLFDGIDEPIATERLVRLVGGLDPDAGLWIIGMSHSDTLGVEVLVTKSDSLKDKRKN